ncbi:DUF6603 domain-containing protein [Streptomyces liangshanensis]|uniref:DUF6603 domain-containing protein n=1 Tax=Streptomyces liangshanensis TaxID=2717324 RepID=A0A6G9H728_9ACTN|nr:DUF6603 domain-containing protein [Streptomyces liangshanensis]QIQ06059.1 hypothetical protein HA039_30470 [Streptomyces liangshanensis]
MTDLAALRDTLTGRGAALELTGSDTALPQPLRDLVSGLPGGLVRLTAAPGGPVLADGVLTLTGTTDDTWPVTGLTGVTVHPATVVVTVTAAPVVTVTATGTMNLAGTAVNVVVAAITEQGFPGWHVTPGAAVAGVRAADLLAIGLGGSLSVLPVPAGLDALGGAATLAPDRFGLSFFPGTVLAPRYAFVLGVPAAQWAPVPSVLELDGLDIAASMVAGSFSVTLIGHLEIGGTPVDLRVGIVPGRVWTAEVAPGDGGTFPGITDLIAWIGGTSGGGGLGGLGFDADGIDAAIEAVRVTFDPNALTLDSVEVVTELTLGALRFDVAVRLPDLTVRGFLHPGDPLPITAVLESFDLPSDGIPADLAVTEASFSAQPSVSAYAAALGLSGVWSAGPLAIRSLGASVAYSATQGLTGRLSGVIGIGTSAELYVSASYEGPSDGWVFTGGTLPGPVLSIGDLLDDLATSFGIGDVPQLLRDLTLTDVSVEYRGGTGAFALGCTGTLDLAGTPVSLTVDIDLRRATGGTAGYSATFGGSLTVGTRTFRIAFDRSAEESRTFVAAFVPGADPVTLTLRDLVGFLSAGAAESVPEGLSVGLESALIAYVRPAGAAQGRFAVALGAAVGADLASLPLIGEKLPAGATLSVRRLRFVYGSGALTAADVAVVNGLLPAAVPPLAPTTGGAQATVDLRIGDTDTRLEIGAAPPPALPPAPAAALTTTAAAAPAAVPADDVTWYPVQKQLGPVTFERVGFTLLRPPDADAVLAFLLDASLAVGGLSLSLDGLSVGIAPGDLASGPRFSLRGLGVAYRSGTVEIGGAFLKDTVEYEGRTYDSYNGAAVLRSGQLQLSALGSYMQLPQGPSLFVYAALNYPIGGPPVFFVRGLAAGFGYNRRLVPPPIDKIATFPLVTEVMSPPSGASSVDVGAKLRALRDYLPPSAGDFFLAVGVRFTSFQMIDSFLLLVVGFGRRVEVNLLGLSTVQLPAPETSAPGVAPIARVQLALQATLVPEDGFFGIRGQLTEDSYLLSRDCRLTGGFAFRTWFGDTHTGDFVVTVGGYHPRYAVPAHYPAVPRLGFSWQVSPELAMKGGAYFALTPSALMAGGSFAATYQDGSTKAWFSASMDFLIGWKPYHYEASFRISVGASYTFWAFGTQTVRVQVDAGVDLWGPEFGGLATVDVGPFSFDVSLGSDAARTSPDALSWTAFRTSLLPAPKDVVTVVLAGGASPGPEPGENDLGFVNALELVLVTDCVVPSRDSERGGNVPLPAGTGPTAFGIAPLGLSKQANVASTHRIEITGSDGADAGDRFTYAPVRKNLPSALWGGSLKPSLGAAATVDGLLTGFTVRPLPPTEPAGPAPSLTRAALQEGTELVPPADDAFRWLPPAPFAETGGPDGPGLIEADITAPGTADARYAIAAALLGEGVPIDLTGFRGGDFRAAPRVAATTQSEGTRA